MESLYRVRAARGVVPPSGLALHPQALGYWRRSEQLCRDDRAGATPLTNPPSIQPLALTHVVLWWQTIDEPLKAAAASEPAAPIVERVRVAEDGAVELNTAVHPAEVEEALKATLEAGIDAPTWLVGLTAAFTTRALPGSTREWD